MSEATQTFLQFFSGGDPNTSVGYRLQMWGAAYDMWIANPLLGSGLGDYSRDLAEMIRLGQSSMNAHFGEAHSLYFEFLGTTGLLGFMTLMAGIFVLPLLTFLGVGRGGGLLRLLDSPASLHGVCLVIAFSSFGISQNWLGRSSISSVYFLCLALFLAAVVYERRKDGIPEKGQGV
jgi:O-antigen ligase